MKTRILSIFMICLTGCAALRGCLPWEAPAADAPQVEHISYVSGFINPWEDSYLMADLRRLRAQFEEAGTLGPRYTQLIAHLLSLSAHSEGFSLKPEHEFLTCVHVPEPACLLTSRISKNQEADGMLKGAESISPSLFAFGTDQSLIKMRDRRANPLATKTSDLLVLQTEETSLWGGFFVQTSELNGLPKPWNTIEHVQYALDFGTPLTITVFMRFDSSASVKEAAESGEGMLSLAQFMTHKHPGLTRALRSVKIRPRDSVVEFKMQLNTQEAASLLDFLESLLSGKE